MSVSPTSDSGLAASVKTFSCPSCGGTVSIRALGTSITAVCQSCGSIIDVANENYDIIAEAAVRVRQSLIPLGTRGILFDHEWEVIGYSERSDCSHGNRWREYLLFNPYQGFRFLLEADGHWSYIKTQQQNAKGSGKDTLHFKGRDYRRFYGGDAIVDYVMGEFYWRVEVGERAHIVDYICPPYILSQEQSAGDVVLSQGIYVKANEIKQAFNVPQMPEQDGIAPNQPGPFAGKAKGIGKFAALLGVTLLVTQIIYVAMAANQTIYQRVITAPASSRGQLLLSDPIDIPKGTKNLEIVAQSPVANNWVELDISLVNDATQESDDLVMPIEYYYGVDSDGSWSEGSQANGAVLSAIPGGHYHLLVEPDAGGFGLGKSVDIDIRVIRDVPIWQNFWIAVLLISAFPIYAIIRRHYFENSRWSTRG